MRKLLSLAALLLLPLSTPILAEEPATAPSFEEEIHYHSIIPEQPGAEGGKVEVVEFFWYGCGHCFSFEPHLEHWLENKPENVEFVRVPAMFQRPNVVMHAKTYYALKLMGLDEQLHQKIFDKIHQEHAPLSTQGQVEEFLQGEGVDVDTYRKHMKSFAVMTQAKRAEVLAERYDIRGVPSIVVDGKYRSGNVSGEQMIALTDHLVDMIAKQKESDSKLAKTP